MSQIKITTVLLIIGLFILAGIAFQAFFVENSLGLGGKWSGPPIFARVFGSDAGESEGQESSGGNGQEIQPVQEVHMDKYGQQQNVGPEEGGQEKVKGFAQELIESYLVLPNQLTMGQPFSWYEESYAPSSYGEHMFDIGPGGYGSSDARSTAQSSWGSIANLAGSHSEAFLTGSAGGEENPIIENNNSENAQIPEPERVILLGIGLLVLLIICRKRLVDKTHFLPTI